MGSFLFLLDLLTGHELILPQIQGSRRLSLPLWLP